MANKAAVQLEEISAEDRRDIDRQVDRILQHPLFHQSKRLPVFLRYIVDESLSQGGQGSTKERTLGVEVFGRKPDYDNNSDPIVRVTATELRKKLAQYYYEDGHNDEIRIELPPGAYLPRFRRSVEDDVAAANQADVEKAGAVAMAAPAVEAQAGLVTGSPQVAVSAVPRPPRWRMIVMVCVALLIVAGGFVAKHVWSSRRTPLDTFWATLASPASRVFIVMPVIGSDNIKATDAQSRSVSVSPNLSLEDTDIAARIASRLEKQGGRFQLVSSSLIALDQLQTEPSVLVGALDNVWTMRLSRDLPFVFEEASDHRTGRIIDTRSGGAKSWTVDIDMPHTRITRDFGIVARFTSRLTGQPVVIVAGISSQGTQAAGRLLTSDEFASIQAVDKNATNFEVVIETEAVDGHAGQPHVVASKTW